MKSQEMVKLKLELTSQQSDLLRRLSAATGMPAEEITTRAIVCGAGALKAGEKLEPATPEQLERLVEQVEADFAAK